MTTSKFKSARFLAIFAASGIAGYFIGVAIARSDLDLWVGGGEAPSPSVAIALAMAAIYALIGGLLVLGAAVPKTGQLLLTGVDEEDLRDLRKVFLNQGASAVLLGLALAVIALSGPGAPIAASEGAWLFIAMTLAGLATYAMGLPMLDEFMKLGTLEAAAIGYGLTVAGIGGWAALAHGGLVAEPRMLTLITIFWGVGLVSSFWAGVRRGLLHG